MDKEQFLATLRRRLKVSDHDLTRHAAVEARLREHPRNTVPERATGDQAALLERFSTQMTRTQGTVVQVETLEDAALAIGEYFDGREMNVSVSAEAQALGLDLSAHQNLSVVDWVAKQSLQATVTLGYSAVAESGSLAIRSSGLNPLTLNFLGEHHVVLLRADTLLGSYEALWDRLRTDGGMPRDLTLVSGPSCTGDIEMIMEYGAHGPRNLHVVIFQRAHP